MQKRLNGKIQIKVLASVYKIFKNQTNLNRPKLLHDKYINYFCMELNLTKFESSVHEIHTNCCIQTQILRQILMDISHQFNAIDD